METYHATKEACPVSDLLEEAGNRRQNINQELNLHLLSDSRFSEQQKLRHVLDWADRFLGSGSEVCHEFCTADSLILANGKKETDERSPAYKHFSAEKCHRPVSSTVGSNGLLEGGSTGKVWQLKPSNYKSREQNDSSSRYKQDNHHISFSFTPRRNDATWPENRETENMKSMELQHTSNKQTPSQDDRRTRGLHTSNQRPQTDICDSSTNQTFASDAAICLTKESTSCWSSITCKKSTVSGKRSENQINRELRKEAEGMVKIEEEEIDTRLEENDGKMHKELKSSSAFMVCANYGMSHNKSWTKRANPGFSCRLKIPSNVTVYEQYQFCVDRLHHRRMRRSQQIKSGGFTESPAKGRKTSEETAAPVEAPASCFEFNFSATNPEIESKRVPAAEIAEITEERSSEAINTNQERKESRPLCQTNTVNGNKHCDFMKRTTEAITSADKVVNTSKEGLRAAPDDAPTVEESASFSVSLPKKTERCPGLKWHQAGGVKGQKETTAVPGPRRLCQKSSMSLSAVTNGRMLPRPHSAGAIKYRRRLNTQMHTKRHTPDRQKRTSLHRDTPTCLRPTETHTHHHDDTRPTSPASGAVAVNNTDWKYSPAGVPACDRWLCLPDEVWLSILSLLPHSGLCTVTQVCGRLCTLATDHTLWKNLRIDNSTLTERWLRFVGTRCPRSLSLYSCSGLSVTSRGLATFLTLCKNSLKEVKVTSCTGPGLHGDQMLPLIGQLCDRVTSVDVSWSGATDTGVRGLSDGCAGLRLKSVVLNGCYVTDDPLKKLVMRQRESLCRLEVFGCQFLTPSCLQTIYEMCPGLKHLNIGQVPKVNTHSLTVMASQLKCLMSLNLTGLQAVSDATVETLLHSCVKLQSLTLSACHGVTDLTLHNISKYTPCIRSLDMSGCKAVTDAGVQSLTLGCRRLQQLDLSSTGTGNRGVTLLANYCSQHLHTVKLSFCRITLERILKLCRHCKRLKVLHLYGCAHLPTERQIREVNAAVKVHPLP